MRRTKGELLDIVRKMAGDEPSDEFVSLMEDVDDSFEEGDGVDWKAKYDELDGTWRKRYTDRFGGDGTDTVPGNNSPADTILESDEDEVEYEDLFEEVE